MVCCTIIPLQFDLAYRWLPLNPKISEVPLTGACISNPSAIPTQKMFSASTMKKDLHHLNPHKMPRKKIMFQSSRKDCNECQIFVPEESISTRAKLQITFHTRSMASVCVSLTILQWNVPTWNEKKKLFFCAYFATRNFETSSKMRAPWQPFVWNNVKSSNEFPKVFLDPNSFLFVVSACKKKCLDSNWIPIDLFVIVPTHICAVQPAQFEILHRLVRIVIDFR